MRKTILVAALAVAAMTSVPAQAGVYTDDATRCIIKSTTDDDHVALVRWIFAAIARHPAIKAYANITPADSEKFDKQMGDMVTRLLTKECRKETVAAIKYEGSGFLEQSFKALGEVAMGGLMGDPSVAAGFQGYSKTLDPKIFQDLATEAGRPVPAK